MIGQTNKQRRVVPILSLDAQWFDSPMARIDGSREWFKLIACVCADGSTLPPAHICNGASGSILANWLSETALAEGSECFVTGSNQDWTHNNLGLASLTRMFQTHTVGERYRLLIVDNHSSHVNYEFLQQCVSSRIMVCILPPHSTHRLRPLDVGVFSPLSTHYTVIQTRWEGRVPMTKSNFYEIFRSVWDAAVTYKNVQSAFRNLVSFLMIATSSSTTFSAPWRFTHSI